jgi:hypothetical protein
MRDPTRDEMLRFLVCDGEQDEFAIEEAIYWFANDWHGGASSNLFAALCSSPYKPGPCTRGPEDATLYDALEEEFSENARLLALLQREHHDDCKPRTLDR